MRLKSVKLTNFRGYQACAVIPIDESMTGIVGRNDYGKSTILEALAIFFETDGAKADKSDMNCFSLAEGAEQFEIACEFDNLPETLVLDDNVETTLAQEYLLNAREALEIVRTFKAATGKPERTTIRCQHPAESGLATLLSLKMADLKNSASSAVSPSRWRTNGSLRSGGKPFVLRHNLSIFRKRFSM